MQLSNIFMHEMPLVLFTTFSQCSIGFLFVFTYFYFKDKASNLELKKFGLTLSVLMAISIIPAFFHLGDIFHAFNIIKRLGVFYFNNSWHIGWMNNEIAFVGLVFVFGALMYFYQKNWLLILANICGILGIFFMAGAYGSMSKTVVLWDFGITMVMFYSAAILLGAIMYSVLIKSDENRQKTLFLVGLFGVGVHFSSIFFQTIHVGTANVTGLSNHYEILGGYYGNFIIVCSMFLGLSMMLFAFNVMRSNNRQIAFLTLVSGGLGVLIC